MFSYKYQEQEKAVYSKKPLQTVVSCIAAIYHVHNHVDRGWQKGVVYPLNQIVAHYTFPR